MIVFIFHTFRLKVFLLLNSFVSFFLWRAKRASICGAERVRLSREAANAELVQVRVEIIKQYY